MTLEAKSVSAAQFEAIVGIAADAIISIDATHQIVLFNQGAEEIFGYQASEVLGTQLDCLIPPRFRPNHAGHIRNFSNSPVPARRMGERREIYGLRKDGSEFPAEASISRIDVDGELMFTVVLRDVSDRKEAEQEITALLAAERNARQTAEGATRMRDEILGIVSHDLRNPISVVSMCAQALQSELGPSDPRAMELADTLTEATSWMQRLIRDLLDVASIDAGRLSVENKPLDLVITLVRAVEIFEGAAQERSINLVTDVPEQLPLVHADSDRVLQVLSNLLGNALKFTQASGTVTVRAAADGDEVTISIIDTGVGIPPGDMPHVFDRFWQARKASQVRGSGLGLAIASGIVAAHNGRIWVESAPGRGSAFHFTLRGQPAAPTN